MPTRRMSEAECRRIVKERSGDICEICPRRAVQCHHRRNRSQGGLWVPSNIMHICVEDHVWIGGNVAAAVRMGWSIQGTQDEPWQVPVRYRNETVHLYDDGSVMPSDWEGEVA